MEIWFIVVCTLIDNEYGSLLFSQTLFRIEDFALVGGSWVIRANENKMADACSWYCSRNWTVLELFAAFHSRKGKLCTTHRD